MQPTSFPLPIPRWPSKASAFLIDPASPCDVAHLAQLAHISFVFHLRSASYRRRSASRCHARSPLPTSGNRVTTMPPPLPLLQLMPPRLSSFRNRSFEVPPMAAIPLRVLAAPLPSEALQKAPTPRSLSTASRAAPTPRPLPTPSLLSSRANRRRHHILVAGRIPSLPVRLLPVVRTPLDPSSFPSYRGKSLYPVAIVCSTPVSAPPDRGRGQRWTGRSSGPQDRGLGSCIFQ
jgi:hypothetical protein